MKIKELKNEDLKELSILYQLKNIIITEMTEEQKKYNYKELIKLYNYINKKIEEVEK